MQDGSADGMQNLEREKAGATDQSCHVLAAGFKRMFLKTDDHSPLPLGPDGRVRDWQAMATFIRLTKDKRLITKYAEPVVLLLDQGLYAVKIKPMGDSAMCVDFDLNIHKNVPTSNMLTFQRLDTVALRMKFVEYLETTCVDGWDLNSPEVHAEMQRFSDNQCVWTTQVVFNRLCEEFTVDGKPHPLMQRIQRTGDKEIPPKIICMYPVAVIHMLAQDFDHFLARPSVQQEVAALTEKRPREDFLWPPIRHDFGMYGVKHYICTTASGLLCPTLMHNVDLIYALESKLFHGKNGQMFIDQANLHCPYQQITMWCIEQAGRGMPTEDIDRAYQKFVSEQQMKRSQG
tara:strand:+ start:3033 stop:4067 length:1035 start_codon:yes stop_codon:yes gene_type:complete